MSHKTLIINNIIPGSNPGSSTQKGCLACGASFFVLGLFPRVLRAPVEGKGRRPERTDGTMPRTPPTKKPGEPPPGVLPTVRTKPKGYLPSPIFSIRALVSGLWPRKRS